MPAALTCGVAKFCDTPGFHNKGVEIMPRVSETEVAKAVEKYLSGLLGRTATIYQIKKALPNYIKLSADDREQSDTRPNEELWEQQVRNIVSHRNSPGNFVYEGNLVYSTRRLSLP
jgi:hypothetical protein